MVKIFTTKMKNESILASDKVLWLAVQLYAKSKSDMQKLRFIDMLTAKLELRFHQVINQC